MLQIGKLGDLDRQGIRGCKEKYREIINFSNFKFRFICYNLYYNLFRQVIEQG